MSIIFDALPASMMAAGGAGAGAGAGAGMSGLLSSGALTGALTGAAAEGGGMAGLLSSMPAGLLSGVEGAGAVSSLSPGFASIAPGMSLMPTTMASANPMAGALANPGKPDPLTQAIKSTGGHLADMQKISMANSGRSAPDPRLQPGQAQKVTTGRPMDRKLDPLEEFALLLRSRG